MSKDTECKERRKKITSALRKEWGLGKISWNCAEESRNFEGIKLKEKKSFCDG